MKTCAVLLVLVAVAVSGCTTPYHPAKPGSEGGYSETRLGADRWRVTFTLPTYEGQPEKAYDAPDGKSYHKMRDLALRRAAELCLGEGNAWFTVESETDATRTWMQRVGLSGARDFELVNRIASSTPRSSSPSQTRPPSSTTLRPPTNRPTSVRVNEPKIILTIHGFRDKPEDPAALEAAPLLEKLRAQYR